MNGTPRLYILLVTLVLVATVVAGCSHRDDGTDPTRTGDAPDTLDILLRGVETPEGVDQAVVNLTVEHLAFYDEGDDAWEPLLTESVQVDLLFAEGDSEATLLVRVPLEPGDYSAVEFVVERARVITEEGATEAEVPRVACYAPLALGSEGDGATIALELWVSGADALERTDDGWRFQPALVGTDSNAPTGDLEISEPDCMPF